MVRFLALLLFLVVPRLVEAQCLCGPACRCEPCLCGLVRTVSFAAESQVTVITMQGCKPCGELKKALASAPELRAFKATVVDRLDARELVRKLGIRSFPTIVVLRPDGTAAWRQTGYDGNAKKLADSLTAALSAKSRGVPRR